MILFTTEIDANEKVTQRIKNQQNCLIISNLLIQSYNFELSHPKNKDRNVF